MTKAGMDKRIKEIMDRPYARVLVPDETGGYVAEVLELPGCVSEGETPDEAIENLEDAMRGWLQVALEDGQRIPDPLEAGPSGEGYNGRILLRVPRSVHARCVRLAEADGVSLNQWLLEAVAERLGAEGFALSLVEQTRRQIVVYEETKVIRRISLLQEEPWTVEATGKYVELPEPGGDYVPMEGWRVAEGKETYRG